MSELPQILDNITTAYIANKYSANTVECRNLNIIQGTIDASTSDIVAEKFRWSEPLKNTLRLFTATPIPFPITFQNIPFVVGGGTLPSYSFPLGFIAQESGLYQITMNVFNYAKFVQTTPAIGPGFIYIFNNGNLVGGLTIPVVTLIMPDGGGGQNLVLSLLLNPLDIISFWFQMPLNGTPPYEAQYEVLIAKLF